ncbi:glucose dehydrogenase [FAD, quinone]-like [Euwallacea similis]|uniref:glucose dehydrogenase [FAD, quinone]-like n=1 Tax=Euwallacea similis TaxID=1736056 RepID=UPI00344CF9E5
MRNSCCFACLIFLFLPIIKADLYSLAELTQQVREVIESSAKYRFPENNNEHFANLDPEKQDYGTFDFIIVGGGTSGGVLANRLTEHKSFKVLVLEAGSADPNTAAILGIHNYMINNIWNWGFNTTPQNNSCLISNKICRFPRGKVLGGSSELNGALHVRGNRRDYDRWAEIVGNKSWSYKSVLPYFRKSEHASAFHPKDKKYHGSEGPQSISLAPAVPGLTEAVIQGFKNLHYKVVDYNGKSQEGCGMVQSYLNYNIRSGSNYSFFRPAIKRPNLTISLKSFVTKVILEGKTAVGVEFVKEGKTFFAKASNEVIMSAGAVSSPQVLMLSGIGPTDELNKHGIEVVADLPVGKHLSEHVILTNAMTLSTNTVFYNVTLDQAMDLWSKRQGPFMANVGRVIAFKDFNGDKLADAELFFGFPLNIDPSGNFIVNSVAPYIQVMQPHSEGEVTLKSSDPRDFPLINPNLLGDERDFEQMYEAVKVLLDLNGTLPIKLISSNRGFSIVDFPKSHECSLCCQKFSKKWWFCLFKYYSSCGFHPIGTTRMGKNSSDSVVDSDLKVHGIKNLRVVDAGIMPRLNSGHTNAPVVMIAEKISDVIKNAYY